MACCHVFAKPGSEVPSKPMEATLMIMAENYFRDRADDCNRLAREEGDLEMRGMLCDLELDYRAKALHAAAQGWRDAPRYFELTEA